MLRALRGKHSSPIPLWGAFLLFYPSRKTPSPEMQRFSPAQAFAAPLRRENSQPGWGVSMRNVWGGVCRYSSFTIPVEDSRSCGRHSYSCLSPSISLLLQFCISTINSPITSGTRVDPSAHSHNAMQWSCLKCTERC